MNDLNNIPEFPINSLLEDLILSRDEEVIKLVDSYIPSNELCLSDFNEWNGVGVFNDEITLHFFKKEETLIIKIEFYHEFSQEFTKLIRKRKINEIFNDGLA